jgi:zinc and cadmium transporter
MSVFLISFLCALGIACLSMIGIFFVALKHKTLEKILLLLISFSAGTLLGGAFFHLLTEAIEEFGNPLKIFIFMLIGFLMFFILEKIFRWHHCHDDQCETKKHLGKLNLIGDGFHNVIDGLVLVSVFVVDLKLGWSILFAIAIHEVVQEIGDFGVLIYSGYTKRKALVYNFISACSILIGVILGYFLFNNIQNLNIFLLPFAAGGFIYIATSDIIPELHKENNLKKSSLSFLFFVLALVVMYFLTL